MYLFDRILVLNPESFERCIGCCWVPATILCDKSDSTKQKDFISTYLNPCKLEEHTEYALTCQRLWVGSIFTSGLPQF